MTTPPLAISLADVESAAERLAGVAVRTPLLENDALNRHARGRVLVKFEGAQHTGSFKFRGAYNRISRLTADERRGGVVAYSSGNHAQGVAAAATRVGVGAVIVMPSDAPAIKIANTRALGGEVVLYDRHREFREEIGGRLARERGATLVKPYDEPLVIAGQGTAGLEIHAQAAERGVEIDQAVVCCGGGGLVAGVATALRGRSPRIAVYAAEPAGFDDTARSLAGGTRVANDPAARSICDALMAPTPGELTFPINRALLAGGLAVTDDEVRAAMRFAFRELKLVVEPGGAVALASVLAGRLETADRTTAVVISGANVDPAQYAAILAAE
jgi:threonine dehydratase